MMMTSTTMAIPVITHPDPARVLLGDNTLGWPRPQALSMSIFENEREMRNFDFSPLAPGRIRQSHDAFSMGSRIPGTGKDRRRNLDAPRASHGPRTGSTEWAGPKQGGRG